MNKKIDTITLRNVTAEVIKNSKLLNPTQTRTNLVILEAIYLINNTDNKTRSD